MKTNKIGLLAALVFFSLLLVSSASAQPSCGAWIYSNTTLTANLSCTSWSALTIAANGITLDCNGFSITGSGTNYGIYLKGTTGVTVKNCVVKSFSRSIWLHGTSNSIIENNEVTESGSAFYISGTGNTLTSNTANNNGNAFFLVSASSNILTGNIANNNNNAFYLYSSSNNDLSDNSANGNTADAFILTSSSNNNALTNNTATGNKDGIYLYGSLYNILTDNTISSNTGLGILLKGGSSSNNLTSNVISNNGGGITFEYSNGNTLTDNSISNNTGLGLSFYKGSGNLIYSNDLIDNGENAKEWTTDSGNTWYLEECQCGNYWSDYVEKYGGVGPYYIPGYAGSFDKYPLPYPYDIVLTDVILVYTDITLTNNYRLCTNGFKVMANGITIDCAGYYIEGLGTNFGIWLEGTTGVTVKNCVIRNFERGIWVHGGSNNILENNTVTESGTGFYVAGSNTALTGNTASSNSIGVYLLPGSNSNTLTNNIVSSNTGLGGIYISGSSSNTLDSNTISSNTGTGIYLGTPLNPSNSNVIKSNVLSGNAPWALHLHVSSDNTIENNIIDNNGVTDCGGTPPQCLDTGGIYLLSSSNNNAIRGNSLTSNGIISIYLTLNSINNVVTGNTISNSQGDPTYTKYTGGVIIYQASGNTIYNNNIINNYPKQALDEVAGSNAWNNGTCPGGNYWSDWPSTQPYLIPGNVTYDYAPYATQNGWDLNNNGIPDCEEVCLATINVRADKHTVGTGSYPGSTKEPLIGLVVGVYDKSAGSCVMNYGVSWQNYAAIVANCNPVATGITDSAGKVTFNIPAGDYLVIGNDGTDKHLGVSASDLQCGVPMQKYLQQIIKADGKKSPGKTTKVKGSELLIIEPEYVEWTGTSELYPFIFETVDSWSTTTSVSPPEGYVTDYNSLSEDVANEIEAVQFTITEVGSAPGSTFVTHKVKGPNGRTVVIKSGIPAATPAQVKASKAKGKGVTGFAIAEGDATTHAIIITVTALTLIGVVLLLLRKKR